MNKKTFKEQVWAYTLLIVGSLLFAVGDVMFVNPYLMAPGGTYGLSNVLNTVWPWKISFYAICMDIPLLIIGTIILGPKFGVKTVVSTLLIFAFTFVLESLWGYNPVIHDGEILNTPIEGLAMVEIPNHGGWFMPDYFLNTVVAFFLLAFRLNDYYVGLLCWDLESSCLNYCICFYFCFYFYFCLYFYFYFVVDFDFYFDLDFDF